MTCLPLSISFPMFTGVYSSFCSSLNMQVAHPKYQFTFSLLLFELSNILSSFYSHFQSLLSSVFRSAAFLLVLTLVLLCFALFCFLTWWYWLLLDATVTRRCHTPETPQQHLPLPTSSTGNSTNMLQVYSISPKGFCTLLATHIYTRIVLTRDQAPENDEEHHKMVDKPYQEALESIMYTQIARKLT